MRYSGSAPAVSATGDGGLPILNYSQIAEWTNCRYRYDLSTRRKIHSRAVIRPLEMGSAIPVGMDAAMRELARAPFGKATGTVWSRIEKMSSKAIKKWAVEQRNIRGDIQVMDDGEVMTMDEIEKHAPQIVMRAMRFINPDRWRTILIGDDMPATELGIMIPFPGWGGFHATVDWVAEDLLHGGVWLWDYKFRKQFTPEEAEETNLQMLIYQKLLFEAYGVEVVGSNMFQGKSRIPATPRVNKNGTISRADVATDWETYAAFVTEMGQDPNDYLDMKEKLDHEFFRMTPAYRSMDEVNSAWDNIVIPTGYDILQNRNDNVFRHFSFMNCTHCWAKRFCMTELRGEDTEFLLSTGYIDLDNPAARLVMSPYDLLD
jgi:hypothetical protein